MSISSDSQPQTFTVAIWRYNSEKHARAAFDRFGNEMNRADRRNIEFSAQHRINPHCDSHEIAIVVEPQFASVIAQLSASGGQRAYPVDFLGEAAQMFATQLGYPNSPVVALTAQA
jgi:hypothetical protein